jgi:hypothetical protein
MKPGFNDALIDRSGFLKTAEAEAQNQLDSTPSESRELRKMKFQRTLLASGLGLP